MSEKLRLNWGIIGTGGIARTFAKSLSTSRTGHLVAVGSRSLAGAKAFASGYPQARAHGSYEALLEDPEVHAVYISTPHPMHMEWTIRAAQAGKHILCEKPFTMNHAEAMAAAEAVRLNGVFLMEAFMYRCHPQTAVAVDIIRSGRLGKVRLIDATFAFRAAFDPKSRLFNPDLGGGAILDVGCYCMSMARLLAGAAEGVSFAEPTKLKALGHLGETGTDELAQAILEFPGDIQARLTTAVALDLGGHVTVTGTDAVLRIPSPWFCAHPTSRLEVIAHNKTEVIEVHTDAPIYSLEADTVAEHLGTREAPAMPVEDTLGNMAALDHWRSQIGLTYPIEKMDAPRPRYIPLRAPNAGTIPDLRAPIPGLDPKKTASRFVLGTMVEGAGMVGPHAFALYDYFFEHGGNIFDTAFIYAGGMGERTMGDWLQQRGLRDEIILIAKGAHSPCCDPHNLQLQLTESLARLRTEHAEIYMMHRDNPAIPVGEFVDVLNQEVRAGRIGIFGGSNWSTERVDAANNYAAEKGLQGFTVLSNQFSLARMVRPVWADCISCSDPASRAWLARTNITNFAWSSQARGFFTRASKQDFSDAELVNTWYSDDNFERLERVHELAREKKTEPVHIAAAYVLLQPTPMFALIGPRKLSEMASSFKAFEVSLTPPEMAWLNLESDMR